VRITTPLLSVVVTTLRYGSRAVRSSRRVRVRTLLRRREFPVVADQVGRLFMPRGVCVVTRYEDVAVAAEITRR